MPSTDNSWYVITGAPSSGKSTVIKRLAKMGYACSEEFGRLLIEQELATGKTLQEIHVDSPKFEEQWIKLQQASEAKLSKSETIFFDRGILDTLAYFRFYGWPLPKIVESICQTAHYKKVFLFQLLEYEHDAVRIESEETAKVMQELFGAVYEEAGYEVVWVPRDSIENRMKLILQHIS